MKRKLLLAGVVLCLGIHALSQTADELVQKNIEAKGGLDKIRAVKTLRITGRAERSGRSPVVVVIEHERPNEMRQDTTRAGMTMVVALA